MISDAEEILGIPPGGLSGRAVRRGSTRRSLPTSLIAAFDASQVDYPQLVEAARAALGAAPSSRLREISVQQICEVGIDGLVISTTTSFALECVEDEVSRIMFSVASSTPLPDSPLFEVLAGGRIVDAHVDANLLLHTVGIELESPLHVGDTAMVSVRATQAPDPEALTGVEIATRRRVHKLAQWVRFHPDAVPDWVRSVETTATGKQERYRGLDTPTSVHQVQWGFGPGTLALRWGYGTPPEPPPTVATP